MQGGGRGSKGGDEGEGDLEGEWMEERGGNYFEAAVGCWEAVVVLYYCARA